MGETIVLRLLQLDFSWCFPTGRLHQTRGQSFSPWLAGGFSVGTADAALGKPRFSTTRVAARDRRDQGFGDQSSGAGYACR